MQSKGSYPIDCGYERGVDQDEVNSTFASGICCGHHSIVSMLLVKGIGEVHLVDKQLELLASFVEPFIIGIYHQYGSESLCPLVHNQVSAVC